MNIFVSKSGHLNDSKKCMVFFIFPKLMLYLMIFPNSATYLALSTLKNHQILQKIRENEEKSSNYPITKMAAFAPKNVHSAVG